MKILMLCNKLPYPPKDGGAIASLNMAKGLAENGCKVDLLAMNTPKHYFDVSLIPQMFDIRFFAVNVPTQIKPIDLLLNLFFSDEPYIAKRFVSKEYQRKLIGLIKENDYDIIQLETPYLAYLIPVIRSLAKVKIVYRAHNVENHIWKGIALKENNFLKKKYVSNLAKRIERFEKEILKAVDFVVPISNDDNKVLQQYCSSIISVVIPTGIELSSLVPFQNESPHNIFFIGALDWMPNQDALKWFIENVWQKLRNATDISFSVAGRNAPKDFVDFMKKNHVDYLGEVNDAREFMLQNGIMIAPLHSGSGMRVKIIEGMSCSKAIIASKVAASGIKFSDKKCILIANSAAEFIQQINFLLNDNSFYNSIRVNALEFVSSNFNNQKLTKELTQFYQLHVK